MYIVIDINTFPCVFEKNSKCHHEFSPILDLIDQGRGVIVYGGSKYKEELRRANKFLKIFRLLKEQNKVCEVDQFLVDEREILLIAQTQGSDCDDQHIIAILGISRCGLLCSADKRSFKFVKDRRLYPSNCSRPKIYTGKLHKGLLTQRTNARLLNVH